MDYYKMCLVFLTLLKGILCFRIKFDDNITISLYYGSVETEHGLPECISEEQACSVWMERFWSRPIAFRLCRCPNRMPCPTDKGGESRNVSMNNRSNFMFCNQLSDTKNCTDDEAAIKIVSKYPHISLEEFIKMHSENKLEEPPEIHLRCNCELPNYWQLKERISNDNLISETYKCSKLKKCSKGQKCGLVRADTSSTYELCDCKRNEICVHHGGISFVNISEIMYSGKGREAYCEKISSY